jgi:hypothetical protein
MAIIYHHRKEISPTLSHYCKALTSTRGLPPSRAEVLVELVRPHALCAFLSQPARAELTVLRGMGNRLRAAPLTKSSYNLASKGHKVMSCWSAQWDLTSIPSHVNLNFQYYCIFKHLNPWQKSHYQESHQIICYFPNGWTDSTQP